MENELYKLMISNARKYLKGKNPNVRIDRETDAFDIAQTLSLCLAKDPNKIMNDLITEHEKV